MDPRTHAIRIDRHKPLRDEPHTGHNRWHPDIPPVLRVDPGDTVILETRDALALRQPERRGLVFLLASIGEAGRDGQQPNAFWQQAVQDFTASQLPVETALAQLLAQSSAPTLHEVDDLAASPILKAALFVALAQRFPTLRAPALQQADTLATTPFPPGPFLRDSIRDLRAASTAR